MVLSGILSRQLGSAFKTVSNLVKPRVQSSVPLNCKYSSSTRAYNATDQEKLRKNYFLANKDVFDRLNMAEFNEFICLTVGRQFEGLDIRQLFFELDTNNDEYISMQEIRQHLERALRDPKTGDLMYAFCRFDKDFDDYLFLHEVREALFYLGFFQAGDQRIAEFFNARDKDKDNKITYKEFAEIVKTDMELLFA